MTKTKPKKKIAICHYRIDKTDGVSLEVAKRKKILESFGWKVKFIVGEKTKNADFVIEEISLKHSINQTITKNSFVFFKKTFLDDRALKKKIKKTADCIEEQLAQIQLKEKFDAVLVHNILSLGGNLPAAIAVSNWIETFRLPTIATHHDFFWERERYNKPRNKYIARILKEYMPPESRHIKHLVINSIAQEELKKKRKIKSVVMPDVMDFSQDLWKKDNYNSAFLRQFKIRKNDLIILQATRIIERKGIELAVDFANELNHLKEKLIGKKLYNGKLITKKSRIFFLSSGYIETRASIDPASRKYRNKINKKILKNEMKAVFADGYVGTRRRTRRHQRVYLVGDVYVHADLVTFPSIWEGWGNQFIEAVFAKKPIVVFEYPVFKKDIKPEGYRVISLGDKHLGRDKQNLYRIPQKNIKKAARKAIRWLLNKDLNKKLEKNFRIGRKHHDFKNLKTFLKKELDLKK